MANRKTWIKLTTLALIIVMVVSMVLSSCFLGGQQGNASSIHLFQGDIDTGMTSYLDSSVMYRLPSTVASSDTVSIIIRTDDKCLLDAYEESASTLSFGEYADSAEADAFKESIGKNKEEILASFDQAGISYQNGADYSVVLSGFEVLITAKDFGSLCRTLGNRGTAIVGEVYHAAE